MVYAVSIDGYNYFGDNYSFGLTKRSYRSDSDTEQNCTDNCFQDNGMRERRCKYDADPTWIQCRQQCSHDTVMILAEATCRTMITVIAECKTDDDGRLVCSGGFGYEYQIMDEAMHQMLTNAEVWIIYR